ncbi:SGNH/GDSL hydrolase family protein [Chryseomicrobium sp. FSL W7-1435]|uniref:SGNH/GDSL hydrolase family protein n=1 Tax=Chryseomicrobium sp. FSL W7-1435 TaxID=2921704 RepID=UPI00315A886D
MKIILFGDSLTARHEGLNEPMINARLKPHFPEDIVLNKGVSGDTTNDAMKRFKKDVLAEQPDVVVIQFGSNDSSAHKHVAREMYKANLEQMVKAIGPERCILVTPPPVDEDKQTQRSNQVLESYGDAVKEVVAEYQTGFADLYKAFMDQGNLTESLRGLEDDGLHYGEAGYRIVEATLVPVITEKKRAITPREVTLLDRIRSWFA